MTINIISDSKIRISLSNDDINYLNLDVSSENPKDGRNREGISALLGIAKKCAGFDAEGKKVKVGVFRTDSGCDIYISKLRAGAKEGERMESLSRRAVLSFSDVYDISLACRRLRGLQCVSSDCFYDEVKGGFRYYLCVEYSPDGDRMLSEPYALCSAREYTLDDPTCKNNSIYDYLTEHCVMICRKNAVFAIANLI